MYRHTLTNPLHSKPHPYYTIIQMCIITYPSSPISMCVRTYVRTYVDVCVRVCVCIVYSCVHVLSVSLSVCLSVHVFPLSPGLARAPGQLLGLVVVV